MDESRVVPHGSHFARPQSHDGTEDNLTWLHRCTVAPVEYFYIDFGLATSWPGGKETATCQGVRGGGYKDAPELSTGAPYNLFPLDIYQLGQAMLDVIKVGAH